MGLQTYYGASVVGLSPETGHWGEGLTRPEHPDNRQVYASIFYSRDLQTKGQFTILHTLGGPVGVEIVLESVGVNCASLALGGGIVPHCLGQWK